MMLWPRKGTHGDGSSVASDAFTARVGVWVFGDGSHVVLRLSSQSPLVEWAEVLSSEAPGPLLATAWVCFVIGVGPLPAADCRAGRSSSVWASSFLLTASIGICICSPCDHRSLQHARYSSKCPADWGRVHEVRRSQPRLSGSLIHNGVAGLGLLATPCWAITFFHTFTVWLAVARTYGASMWVSPTFNALRFAGRQRFTISLLKSGTATGPHLRTDSVGVN